MRVGAMLVVGQDSLGSEGPYDSAREWAESLGTPVGFLEVMGESVLQRTVWSLVQSGVNPIVVVADDTLGCLLTTLPAALVEISLARNPVDVWCVAERSLRTLAQQGIETVLMMRVGSYMEFDLADLLEFHRGRDPRVTSTSDARGPLEFWVLDTSRLREDGKSILGEVMEASQGRHVDRYLLSGYVNRLTSGREYRTLVADALLSRCSLRPHGHEMKPGVWVADRAEIHRRARIVAPTYIGRGSRLRAGTLITGFTTVESGCEVDSGTVVEDSSILPNTYLGKWLDVSHVVVQGTKLLDLRHDVTVEVDDSKLIDEAAHEEERPRLAVRTSAFDIAPNAASGIDLGAGVVSPRFEPNS